MKFDTLLRRTRTSLISLVVALSAIVLIAKTVSYASDPIAPGHLIVSPISDSASTPCHVIRYQNASCPFCRSDGATWRRFADTLRATGCDVFLLSDEDLDADSLSSGRDARLVSLAHAETLPLTKTPTTVITNDSWRIIWAHTGALTNSTADEVRSRLTLPLIYSVLLGPETPSRSSARAARPLTKVLIEPGESPRLGRLNAPVQIVEFGDYDCPFCRSLFMVLNNVLRNRSESVSLVYKQLPLGIHPDSERKTRLALAASILGKFWPVHEYLYTHVLKDNQLPDLSSVGVAGNSMAQIVALSSSDVVTSRLLADKGMAEKLGVEGTPTIYINGEQYAGRLDYIGLSTAIDRAARAGR